MLDKLAGPAIAFLAESFVAQELADDEAHRSGFKPPTRAYPPRRDPEVDYLESRVTLTTYDTAGLVGHWGDWTAEFTHDLGYVLYQGVLSQTHAGEFPKS